MTDFYKTNGLIMTKTIEYKEHKFNFTVEFYKELLKSHHYHKITITGVNNDYSYLALVKDEHLYTTITNLESEIEMEVDYRIKSFTDGDDRLLKLGFKTVK